MEGNRRQMNTGKALRPDLWSRLPPVLIDTIILKVLIDLPFSRLHSFCCFCKRWKDYLLSSTHYLLYFHRGELKVFNSKRGKWETISLKFCEDENPGLRVQKLRLVSSRGGLLCLSSFEGSEYIVCNPLTRCCKKLSGHRWPRPTYSLPVPHAKDLGTRVVALSTWSKAGTKPELLHHEVFTFHSDIKGDVQLMLSTGRNRRTTLCRQYRYRSLASMQLVTGVHDGFCLFLDGIIMPSRRLLTLGFYRGTHSAGFNVLVYDFTQRRCRWIMTPEIPQDLTRRSRKRLVGTISVAHQMEVQEIGDTGHAVAFPTTLRNAFENFMARISESHRQEVLATSRAIQMIYVEEDDVAYVVALVGSPPIGPFEVIDVCRHCRVNKSEILSERKKEWKVHAPKRSFATCFHVFKPSFNCAHGSTPR